MVEFASSVSSPVDRAVAGHHPRVARLLRKLRKPPACPRHRTIQRSCSPSWNWGHPQRVIFQLITESVTLASIGAAFAVALAGIGSRLMVVILSTGRRDPVRLDLTPDAHVLLFAIAVGLITGIVFGGLPALSATGLARVLPSGVPGR